MKKYLVMFRGGFDRVEIIESELSREQIIEHYRILYGRVPKLLVLVSELVTDEWEFIGTLHPRILRGGV